MSKEDGCVWYYDEYMESNDLKAELFSMDIKQIGYETLPFLVGVCEPSNSTMVGFNIKHDWRERTSLIDSFNAQFENLKTTTKREASNITSDVQSRFSSGVIKGSIDYTKLAISSESIYKEYAGTTTGFTIPTLSWYVISDSVESNIINYLETILFSSYRNRSNAEIKSLNGVRHGRDIADDVETKNKEVEDLTFKMSGLGTEIEKLRKKRKDKQNELFRLGKELFILKNNTPPNISEEAKKYLIKIFEDTDNNLRKDILEIEAEIKKEGENYSYHNTELIKKKEVADDLSSRNSGYRNGLAGETKWGTSGSVTMTAPNDFSSGIISVDTNDKFNVNLPGTYKLVTNGITIENLIVKDIRIAFSDKNVINNSWQQSSYQTASPLYAKVEIEFDFVRSIFQNDIQNILRKAKIKRTST